jgi:hypothetical protein
MKLENSPAYVRDWIGQKKIENDEPALCSRAPFGLTPGSKEEFLWQQQSSL